MRPARSPCPTDWSSRRNGTLAAATRARPTATAHAATGTSPTPISNYCVALNIAPYELLEHDLRERRPATSCRCSFYVLPEHEREGPSAPARVPRPPALLRGDPAARTRSAPRSTASSRRRTSAWSTRRSSPTATASAHGRATATTGCTTTSSSHEWWANLVTCRDWKDMWIHEGFGTYMQALYLEQPLGARGLPRRRCASQRSACANRAAGGAARARRTRADLLRPAAAATTTSTTRAPGCCTRLRWLLGDETFFQACGAWPIPTPAIEKVTDGSQVPLRRHRRASCAIVEKIAGRDLGWFFEVYLRQPALPLLVAETSNARARVEGARRPAVPDAGADRRDGETRRVELPDGHAMLPLPADAKLEVDPEGWVLRK